jgi:mRNA interferase RelE/StbE
LAWDVKFAEAALADLKTLDFPVQKRILRFARERLANAKDPRTLGDALHGDLSGYWRYRVGDYRLICDVRDKQIVIVVLQIGHRREIYR